jgi:hypothetical protein
MADIVDRANDIRDLEIESLINGRASPRIPVGHGRCLYCDERVDPPARWCDADCRDGWEKVKRAQAQRPERT